MGTYVVKVVPSVGDAPKVRLVEAKQERAAITHVAKDTISASLATSEELLEYGAAGLKLEKANGGE